MPNIDTANLTNDGFSAPNDDDKLNVRLIRLTAADIASPPARVLYDTINLFKGPDDDVRYYSSGEALVPMNGSGAGSGGSSGLAFPSDATAVGAGGTPITVDGVGRAMAYNVDDSVSSETVELTAADDVVRTANYGDGGIPYYSGNIVVQGAWRMTEAQAKAFVTEVLTPAGTAAIGFRLRIPDFSWRINAAGTTIYKEAEFEWDGEQLTAVRSVYRETQQTATHTGSTSKSSALRSLVFPGWLLGTSNVMQPEMAISATGASSTLRAHIEPGGTDVTGALGGSGSTPSNFVATRIRQLGGSSQIAGPTAAGGGGGYVASGSAYNALTLNPATDITIDYKVTLGDAGLTATLRYAGWRLLPPGV